LTLRSLSKKILSLARFSRTERQKREGRWSMHHKFTSEQIAAGWRFGIWQNLQPNGKPPGGYVRKDGRVLRFETSEIALHTLRALGFREHVGADGWTLKRPTAYICQVPPETDKDPQHARPVQS
jgi:hypothetical protein